MSTVFIGSLMSCAFDYAQKGFALCNGQSLAINQYQALFTLIGTTFGGNGTTTFNLPNLQSLTPIGAGQGQGLSPYVLGQKAGEAAHTLITSEMPGHTHTLNASGSSGSLPRLVGNSPGISPSNVLMYGAPLNLGAMNPQVVGQTGGNVPHENRQPFLVINWVIALVGLFPTRS